MNLTDEERRDARSRPFPLQIATYGDKTSEPGPPNIPWSVADKAYCVYARRYGSQQSVERLSQRGGFSLSEMDDLYPPWRGEVSEIARLTKANAELQEALELLLPVAQEFERQSSHGPGGGRGYVVFTKARKALANSSEGE